MKNTEFKKNRHVSLGILLIVLGCFLVLLRLDIIPWNLVDFMFTWQMLVIAIGLAIALNGNRVAGSIIMALGLFFLLPELPHVPYEIKKIYWPLIIIALGIFVIMRHRGEKPLFPPSPPDGAESPSNADDPHNTGEGGWQKTPPPPDFERIEDFVIFGGRDISNNSRSFRGGKATAIFGGIEYDFRQAQLPPQGAVVDCVCVFGGIGIKVPADWNVINQVTTVLGAYSDKRNEVFLKVNPDRNKTVLITGTAIFGGIEIKYV